MWRVDTRDRQRFYWPTFSLKERVGKVSGKRKGAFTFSEHQGAVQQLSVQLETRDVVQNNF